ncbi:MAG TPA: DNA-binding protein [Saprospiraceae bacterium]|jgi:predicted transcriptional regulator|nr:DNA-binding protein [Saprospiraceae bacterium]HMP14180.1 DNA-binding protein [Saprospiraceae bacterium]
MTITVNELREIKHQMPTGSVKRIAKELNIDEQTVRNYFSAGKTSHGSITTDLHLHVQPGPDGGVVRLDDTTILDLAKRIIAEHRGHN